MAENTRLKELQADVKRNSDTLEKYYSDLQAQIAKLESVNSSRFEHLETVIHANDDKFNQISDALETLLQRNSPFQGSSHGASNSLKPPFQVRNVKLDFPRFDGNNVMDWIFKAEQFFDYYATSEADRLTIASVHLDNDIVPWFQMMQRSSPFRSWHAFTEALELDFGPSAYECPRASLFKLNQTGSVADYYKAFTALANRVSGLSNEALLDYFLSGLQDEIRRDVMALSPPSLVKAVALAKLFEEKYTPSSAPKTPSYQTKAPTIFPNRHSYNTKTDTSHSLPKSTLPPLLPTPNTKPFSQSQKHHQVKKNSPAEMQIRREKGLCYFCDEKFSFTHKCPNRQMMMLQLIDDDLTDSREPDPPDLPQPNTEVSDQEHHLSLNAMKGAGGVGTIGFTGHIGPIEIKVLVDGGSSGSFIQPRIAHFLKLPIEPAPCFQVFVGNGQSMTTEDVIQQLTVIIQGHKLVVPVYLLPVSGADLVLGSSWLATLGPHIVDYATSTLKFFQHGKFVVLQGEHTDQPQQAQLHHMRKMQQTKAIAKCFSIQMVQPELLGAPSLQFPADLQPDLAALLYKYQNVFQTPLGLPPPRAQDHAIPLQAGSKPVKVRPYRYPHSQKEQIEKRSVKCLSKALYNPARARFHLLFC